MQPRQRPTKNLLEESLQNDRIHSGYLFVGLGNEPRTAALDFARALICSSETERPCEACPACRRSREKQPPLRLDGKGKEGPFFRHIGDHPNLFWVERGVDDTRVRVEQIRELQIGLRRTAHEPGYRVAVVADGEFLNAESQNALLRLLEEPPPQTTLLLIAASAENLLPTVRSRCQRIRLPAPPMLALADPSNPDLVHELAEQLDALHTMDVSELLDWAERYRGARATMAPKVECLLETGSRWLHERVTHLVHEGVGEVEAEVEAFSTLTACRKALVQRNANPQMIAERALFALRDAANR